MKLLQFQLNREFPLLNWEIVFLFACDNDPDAQKLLLETTDGYVFDNATYLGGHEPVLLISAPQTYRHALHFCLA